MEGKTVEYTFNAHNFSGGPAATMKRPALVIEHDKKTKRSKLAVFSVGDGLSTGPQNINLVLVNDAERGFGPGQWHEYGALI